MMDACREAYVGVELGKGYCYLASPELDSGRFLKQVLGPFISGLQVWGCKFNLSDLPATRQTENQDNVTCDREQEGLFKLRRALNS